MVAILTILVLSLPTVAFGEQVGRVTASYLKLHQSADLSSKCLYSLPKNTKVTVKETIGDWYKVVYGKYTGYVWKTYVKIISGSNTTSTKTTKLLKELQKIGKPDPCRPGDKGDNVKKLQRCLVACGYYPGGLDGIYGKLTKNAVSQFQRDKKLSVDGIAGKKTLATMFGDTVDISKSSTKASTKVSAKKSYTTENLDWFNGGSNTIPRGAVVTVKDCKTGKTFRCQRWAGANHMDTMPLTKEDTAVIKSLYGDWSWNRRAVLVLYNGHVYAGSMNGMPHGSTTIQNNNFPGHFCIHFLGSKTHGTKKVDATHQSCVHTALNYKW